MSNKLKFRPERGQELIEFNNDFVHIELPNGTGFRLNFDPKENALVVQKEWAIDGDSRITIHPGVSNVIIVK